MTTQPTTTNEALEPCEWCKQPPETWAEPGEPHTAAVRCVNRACPVRQAGWLSPGFWNTRSRVTAPIVAPVKEICVKCNHLKLNPWRGYCKHETSPFGKRPVTYCGCTCEFAAPASTVAPVEQSEPWRDEGGHAWERRANVACVECPHCCFVFAAEHTDGYSSGYSCPNCQGCPDAAPASPVAIRDETNELAKLRQAIGWICDAADAAYIEDSDSKRIQEIFNIAAKAAGLTRRLPDEHGRFDETSIG